MKTKIKRHSRSVLSVILAISMLISCMMVGLIATDAARVTGGDDEVGATTYYYHYGTGNNYWSSNGVTMTQNGSTWYADIDFTTQYNNYVRINTTSSSIKNSNTTSVSNKSTNNYSSVVNQISYYGNVDNGYAGYKIELKSAPSSSTKVRISFDTSDMSTLIVSDPTGGSGGGGEGGDPSGATSVTDTDLIGVLSGTKMMIYLGEDKGWGDSTFYIMSQNNTSNAIASATRNDTAVDYGSGGYKFALFTLDVPVGDYYMGHWASGLHTTPEAGFAYGIRNETGIAFDNHTWIMNNDSRDPNSLYKITAGTRSVATTIASSINQGSTLSVSTGSAGESVIHSNNTIEYYVKSGSNYYSISAASGVIDTSAFSAGNYTLITVLKDGRGLRVVADSDDFTVIPLASALTLSASKNPLTQVDESTTLTATASDLLSGVAVTYKLFTSDGTQVGSSQSVAAETNSVNFTVTPNARSTTYYATVDFTSGATANSAVTSNNLTITNSADDYIPRYTIGFQSNNNTYGTVTAKKADGTVLATGDRVKEGESVTFTATAKAGNEFVSWDAFNTKSTSVTRDIYDNMNVTGTFGPKGYQIGYIDTKNNNKPNWLGNMRELPNGTYITDAIQGKETTFTIKRNYDGKYTNAGATNNKYNFNSVNDSKATPASWDDYDSMTATTDYYYINFEGGAYVLYDPATDKVWLTSDQDDLYDVEIYAKDGTIRDNDNTYTFHTSSEFGNTTITMVSPANFTDLSSGYEYNNDSYRVNSVAGTGRAEYLKIPANDVRNGVTIKIATQTTSEKVAEGYYVKGFVVSGHEKSYSVLWQEFDSNGAELSDYHDRSWIHTGYNEFELTIEGYPDKQIEITPIYFKKEKQSGDNVRFYVEGFAGTVAKEWKNTLSLDVYNTSNQHIYGDYPGQLMINYNGRYLMDIPRENLKGITLNNYVWDKVHSHIFYGGSTSENYQTYDFNDFIYINERLTTAEKDEDIVFSFRERVDADHATKETSQLGQSTYYKDSESLSGYNYKYDYRNGFNTIDPDDSIYQWENLTNLYKDRVDIFGDMVDTKDTDGNPTNTKANYNPIRIVSNGYDYNKAGKYATAWALYKPVDASGTYVPNGSYDHYQLFEVGGGQGKSNFDSSSYYVNPAFDTELRLKYDYEYCVAHNDTSHFIYDLAKMPTLISYEFQVEDGHSNLNLEGDTGNGEVGKRSDGRWYVTSSDKLLTAHTIIQYAEKDDEDLYVRDYYQSGSVDYTSETGYNPTAHTGLSTGIQAYFDNEDSDDGEESNTGVAYQNVKGNTEAFAVSDGDHVFKLKTVGDSNGDYVFKGWYLFVNDKYTFVSDDPEYDAEATANDVYVARYYKVPSGTLNISHLLSSDSKGTAKCEVKAEILGTNGTTVEDSNSYPYTEGSLRITNKHIKKSTDGHSKYIRITLKTSSITGYFDEFEKNINDAVSALTDSDNLGIGATVTIDKSGNDKTATITFPIDSLINSDGNQTTKSLPFYSKIGTYKYSLHFDFQGYRNLYGNLGYDVAETEFTAKELEDYFVLANDVIDKNNNTVTAYKFKNDDARNAFINLKAPYENTFMETVKWQTDMYGQEHPEGMTATYSSSEHKWSFVVKLKKTDDRYAFVKLRFPYTVKNYDPDKHAPQTSTITIDGQSVEAVAKLTNNEYVEFGGRSTTITSYRTGYGANYFISGSYLTAADKVWNTTDQQWEYFDYWKVENVGDSKTGSAEYTRCYYPEFNLSLYQDSILTPIYTTRAEGMSPSQRAAADDTARTDTYSTGGRATITMMENSRMQWTGGRAGNTLSGTYVNGGDRIYTDFLVSYTYGDKQLNTDTTGMNAGIVIETVRDLDSNENGYYTKTQAEYKTSDDSTINKANIKAFIEGGANSALLKTEFSVTTLDNKNRKNQYYSLPNISQTSHNPTERKNKLYRAYSYLKDKDDNVLLISDPIYFTIYDIASIENMSAGAEYGGVS